MQQNANWQKYSGGPDNSEAVALYEQATELKKRFNDYFWMDDEGTFAMGIDNKGELIRSGGVRSRTLFVVRNCGGKPCCASCESHAHG